MHCSDEKEKMIPSTFTFEEIQRAFVSGSISLKAFADILADNFGKKKARKILRNNLDIHLKEMQMSWPERQEHLHLISLLI